MVRRVYETYRDSSPADTAAILRGITGRRGSDRLLGDESGHGQQGFMYTGKRRDISPSRHIRLAAATYEAAAIEHMSDVLVPVLGLRFEPPVIGHAEFTCGALKSAIEGQIYVSEERVIANALFRFSPEDWGSPVIGEAAEFVDGLGLGDHWSRSLELTYAGRNPESTVVFSGEHIDALNNALVRHGELTK
jgi:hypothetical protein